MVFAVPPIIILAAWWRGSRPSERRPLAAIAGLAALASVPAVIWSTSAPSDFSHGVTYALVWTAAALLAMLLRRRGADDGGDDDGGGGEPGPEGEPPGPDFDWDEFERDFWREVERRRGPRRPRERVPV
jgi:hypothetical protein